jgi:hypothetical protein
MNSKRGGMNMYVASFIVITFMAKDRIRLVRTVGSHASIGTKCLMNTKYKSVSTVLQCSFLCCHCLNVIESIIISNY